jgi:hypothetical protein
MRLDTVALTFDTVALTTAQTIRGLRGRSMGHGDLGSSAPRGRAARVRFDLPSLLAWCHPDNKMTGAEIVAYHLRELNSSIYVWQVLSNR